MDNQIRYWEIWMTDDAVTIHEGDLGSIGDTTEIRTSSKVEPRRIIEREVQQAKSRGFSEVPDEQTFSLIVQYRINGHGSPDDLDKRHRVENLLDECLGWTGNGHCDGGDIGSGTMNIFAYVVDPDVAAQTVLQTLETEHMLEGAIIAINDDEDLRVVWPTNYTGQFSY